MQIGALQYDLLIVTAQEQLSQLPDGSSASVRGSSTSG
jgi:hypothetical protein